MEHPTRRFDPPEPDDNTRRLEETADVGGGKEPPRCPTCNGERIWASSQTPMIIMRFDRDPGFLGRHTTKCDPLVCLDCGLVEQIAREPRKLLAD